jgi:hypothetical protein
MAIQTKGVTVINDSREVVNVAFTENCTYKDWQPVAQTITTDLDWHKPLMKLDMTGNVTFTYSNLKQGSSVVLILDTTATPHTPTFPADIKFPTAVTWTDHRYWIISMTCWDVSPAVIRATAVGYDALGTPSSSMDSTFTIPTNWVVYNTFVNSVGFPECYCYISFTHEPGNNRIKVDFADGDSSQPTNFRGPVYINYTGLTNITSVQVQYNVQSQSCSGDCTPSNYGFGPTPVSDGYNSGTYDNLPTTFGWMAQANPNSFATNRATTQAAFNSANPDFRVKLVCDQGTFYCTGEMVGKQSAIYLDAQYGTVPIK